MNLMHKMHNAHHMPQGHASQHIRTLESQPSHLVIFICKDTIAPGLVDYQLANVDGVLSWNGTKYTKFKIFHVTVIVIDNC